MFRPLQGFYLGLGLIALTFVTTYRPAAADELFPAHRVIGNTYYVGSKELATYLIQTPEGHMLINSGFEETVPMIRAAVESLGFKMRDVKILLASHAHSDHVAGHAMLKELTGAKVFVMEGDDRVIADGGAGQYHYTDSRWPKCAVDRVLYDGDEVKLGGVTLVARRTPGHTRGCTTWTWRVDDGGKAHNVVVIGSPNVNPGYQLVDNADYPTIAADFATTFKVLKSLPCDVFLGAHGNYYGMLDKHDRLSKQPSVNPFVDPAGYQAYVELKEQAYRKTLADQQAAAATKSQSANTSAASDERAIVEQLKKYDAQVVETKGVVTSVSIRDTTKMTDADFQALGRLRHLKLLTLSGENVNDQTLAYLTNLTALEDLSTNAAQFSDDGLRQLTKLANLKQIKFFHTSLRSKHFNGSGFAHFTELKNLRRLTVAGCPFNDEGMAAVGKLTQLENFRTWHTYQTEAGNKHLTSLANLRSLHLGQRLRHYDGTSNAHSLSDQTLVTLAAMATLDTLILDEAVLSVEALEKLKGLKNLKRVELGRIDLSPADVERLKTSLPGVEVVFKPMTDADRTALERFLKL